MKYMLVLCCLLFLPSIVDAEEFTFQSGDFVELFVYNAPELSGEFRIQYDGFLRLPLIGKVQAAGATEDELYKTLFDAISVYIKSPKMTLIPRFSVSVLGYVSSPGVYSISSSSRLIEIIAQAEGFTQDASRNLVIYRNGEQLTVSVKSILENSVALEFAQPGDVIFARRKLLTRGDISFLLSIVSMLTLATYYSSR
jgi:polysaccharide biosynthesis/export protein